jgi:alkylation response protein AidB-like acyl-CoA dehydrogenase
MDLNYTPSELAFRDELRGWLAANLPRDWDGSQGFEYQREWQRRVHAGGWAGVAWPREYGGRGATAVEQVIFVEEMARAGAPPLANVLGLGLIGPTIIAHGSEAQKRRYLSKILSADEIWCQGFSEPNAGSDLANVSTSARLEGGEFVVNGHKVWTSFGNAAHWCELVARTDAGAAKHRGLTVLLIDMRSPGVEARPLRQMTGESEFSELFFDNVRVPAENVLGAVNDGWNVALGTLMHERATLGAGMHILYKRQFERLLELARQRGRACDPLVRQKLAQVHCELEVLRLNQMRAVSRIGNGATPGPEGSILKLCWSELNQRFQQIAQEILGPYGQLEKGGEFALDNGQWAYLYLRARGNTIEAGTSEIQRNIIGHFVLGLPRSY